MGSRPVTDAEWDSLLPDFPNLDRSYTFWQAPETPLYNCIAWSMGINWTWIDPPSDQNSFTLLYKSLGFKPCAENLATVDGYALNGEMTHASCLVGTTWSSKLGEEFRISHTRVGLVGGILYGDIVSHYCPATTSWSLPKDLELEPANQEVVQQIATLADSIKTSYPELTNNFDTLYAAWKETWFLTFNMALQQSSAARANGPQWEAVVALGPAVLPLVVAKLTTGVDAFAVQLYNRLETDTTKKVDPDDLQTYYFLKNQAQTDVTLFSSDVSAFNTLADLWIQDQSHVSRSSRSADYLNHDSYNCLIQMGKSAIPLIMERYARDQEGWWHELMYEIVHQRRSGSMTFHKVDLFASWKNWFQNPSASQASSS
ncbi:hypothetical protein V502_06411 [Pseudogymnoascus sp. VKM F-4520 (FW-2644)]|nr:hypothetical protein V502_06411 [Pseudogymnoascus sp. VKM F-4520 (FW-2644)]